MEKKKVVLDSKAAILKGQDICVRRVRFLFCLLQISVTSPTCGSIIGFGANSVFTFSKSE